MGPTAFSFSNSMGSVLSGSDRKILEKRRLRVRKWTAQSRGQLPSHPCPETIVRAHNTPQGQASRHRNRREQKKSKEFSHCLEAIGRIGIL
jgi:hypothetical protein